MIWYIVTDSVENYRQHYGAFGMHKLTLERLSRDVCLMTHYTQVSARLLKEAHPWAICHSGGSALYDTYDVLDHRGYGQCVLKWDIPQIGFCGGMQVLAVKLGGTIGPMREVRGSEADHNPGYLPGTYKEWGVYPVRIEKPDPLFRGLSNPFRVQEFHSWEVKDLGPQLNLLATSDTCHVQAFVQKDRPVYGTQFHPEQSCDNYPDGFRLIENFYRIARRYNRREIRD
jgi:GMP synthase-like glutamine amidotransferase